MKSSQQKSCNKQVLLLQDSAYQLVLARPELHVAEVLLQVPLDLRPSRRLRRVGVVDAHAALAQRRVFHVVVHVHAALRGHCAGWHGLFLA